MLRLSHDFLVAADGHDYAYQWTWLGMPIIQLPPDILAIQEVIWQTKPDVIIETGVAWGGSIVFYASILELIGSGVVIGVDRVLPDGNRSEILKYPFSHRIALYEGSSTDTDIIAAVKSHIDADKDVMVILDSNHTHDHVLAELRAYAPLVTARQYLVVTDTIIETLPGHAHRPRPWGPGNNPKSALDQYMKETDRFEVDTYIDAKLLTTFCPKGYLRCIK